MKKLFLTISLSFFVLAFIFLYDAVDYDFIQTSSVMQKIEEPNIVIDCGHGGEDGGAVSPQGYLEKDINLQIGLDLQKLMLQSGFKVTMIRTDDTSIADSDKSTLREKKVSDLHNRVEIINNDSNNILISIHQNKFEESKYSGAQVFYSETTENSKVLAEYIRLAVKGLLQNNNERKCKPTTKDIYILKNAKVPAVLIECGFLSNQQEEQKLITEEYRNQIAFCIYSGFLEYYYQNY